MPPRPLLMPTLSAAVGTVMQIFLPAPADRAVSTLQPNLSPMLTLMYVRTILFGIFSFQYQKNGTWLIGSSSICKILYCNLLYQSSTNLIWLTVQVSIVLICNSSTCFDDCFAFRWIRSSLERVLTVYCSEVNEGFLFKYDSFYLQSAMSCLNSFEDITRQL